MKEYSIKCGDSFMEWNTEYYTFQAKDDEDAKKIAEEYFRDEYLPEILLDPQSYSEYPCEEDYDTEEDYLEAVTEAENELSCELSWKFINNEDLE